MSDMNLDVVWRSKIGEAETLERAQEIVEPLFGKPDFEEEFSYEKKGNLDVAYIDNEVFLDYYFKDGEYVYDIDITFGLKEADTAINEMGEVFSEEQQEYLDTILDPYVEEACLRVLYFYNGGCGGLREVK